MFLINFAKRIWRGIMDESRNPLSNYPLSVAHMLMQMLAWMWSVIFSIAIGSYLAFGISAIGHALVISGLFVTFLVFQRAERKELAMQKAPIRNEKG